MGCDGKGWEGRKGLLILRMVIVGRAIGVCTYFASAGHGFFLVCMCDFILRTPRQGKDVQGGGERDPRKVELLFNG